MNSSQQEGLTTMEPTEEVKNNSNIGTGIAWGMFWVALSYLIVNASTEDLHNWFGL